MQRRMGPHVAAAMQYPAAHTHPPLPLLILCLRPSAPASPSHHHHQFGHLAAHLQPSLLFNPLPSCKSSNN